MSDEYHYKCRAEDLEKENAKLKDALKYFVDYCLDEMETRHNWHGAKYLTRYVNYAFLVLGIDSSGYLECLKQRQGEYHPYWTYGEINDTT